MKLHENREDFLSAIQVTARTLGIREVFVEKDYWVCYILKNLSLSQHKNEVVFKGGTSLSKAHKIIHRFSEDVDLAIIANDKNDNQIKKLISAIEKDIVKTQFKEVNKTNITSKHGRFRKTVWEYERASSGDFGHANPELLLEINSFTVPSPFHAAKIQTYIADYFDLKEFISEKKNYGLDPFEVNVLDIRRTFAEKVAAIIRASQQDQESHSDLKRKIRHLYDLAMLVRNKKISEFLENGDFKKFFEAVKKDDQKVSKEQNEYANIEVDKLAIFHSTNEVIAEITSTYKNEFATLVYNLHQMPSLEEVKKTIETIKRLIEMRWNP
jgi:predicted nucleotidyltransferase component of viral defense system